jgi:hypothetical protein
MYYDTALTVTALLRVKKTLEEYDRFIEGVENMDDKEFFDLLLRQ